MLPSRILTFKCRFFSSVSEDTAPTTEQTDSSTHLVEPVSFPGFTKARVTHNGCIAKTMYSIMADSPQEAQLQLAPNPYIL